jgi:transglutaminase-like putative cysteine protease
MPGRFLREDRFVNYSDCSIATFAEQLFSLCSDDVARTKAAFECVRDEIPHSADIDADVITSSASEVLKHRTGICHAKSNLLAAFLRYAGIPAGFCYQHITLADDDSEGYCLHCFNAVFLNGMWVMLDARGNKNGVNVQFSSEKPAFAFPCRSEYDEYFFPGIYAKPDGPTMRLLVSAGSLDDVLGRLPEYPEAEPDIIPD